MWLAWSSRATCSASRLHPTAPRFWRNWSSLRAPMITLDTVGRASFRTRETVSTEAGLAVEAATTLEVPGRSLLGAEREALAQ